jgi:hypothetical protein
MSNKELNSVEQDSTKNNSSLNQPGSRRKFFKKAAIGSALITTVTSRPVWGSVSQCTVSGNLSNNSSNHNPDTHCSHWGYSGGAWCNGHADNNNFWALIGVNKNTPLSSLLGSNSAFNASTVSNLKIKNVTHASYNKPIARIGDALGCNDDSCDENTECEYDLGGYSFVNLGFFQAIGQGKVKVDSSDKGLWKQRAVAALNMLLWNAILTDQNNGCLPSGYSNLHSDFYFKTDLPAIMSSSQAVLETANRDGFTSGFVNICP